MGHPRWRSRGSPTRARASLRGRSFLRSRVPGRQPRLRAPGGPARGGRARLASARWGSPSPELWCRGRARGDGGRRRRASTGTPPGGSSTSWASRAQRQDHHGLPRAPPPRGRRPQTGLLGTVKSVVGGRGGGRSSAQRPRRSTCRETFRRMLDAGDRACVDGGLVARARARRRRRNPLRLPRLHEPHPGPPGLPPHDGRTTSRPSDGCSREPGPLVVNVDDPWGRASPGEVESVTFGDRARGGLPGPRVRFDLAGSRFICDTPEGGCELRSPLPGLFNVQNVLAAVAAARSLGVPLDAIAAALAGSTACRAASSRWTRARTSRVLVDYAHTPDSLENVLRAARELTDGRLHVPCSGRAATATASKRPLMGEAAGALADRVIVTSDNPRSEDPERIIDEVMAGAGGGRRARGGPAARDRAGRRGRRAGRRGRDRRQGPRAGPGVRGRPQGAVRRRDGGARGAALAAGRARDRPRRRRLAAAAGGELVAGDRAAPGPRARWSTRVRSGPGDLFVGLPGEHADGGEFAAAGAGGRRLGGARRRREHASAAHGARSACSSRTIRWPRSRALARALAPRARLPRGRDHGLDRQDLDQGHPRRAAARRSCGPTRTART